MNRSHIQWVVSILLMASVAAGIATYSPPDLQGEKPSSLEKLFHGDIAVRFNDSVSKPRMDEIADSVGGKITFYSLELHQAQIHFNPPLSLEEADQTAATLKHMQEVKSAGPQFNSLVQ